MVCMEHRKFGYNGGKNDYFDYIDPDEMSLLEFETMAEQLGYSKDFSVWCKVFGEKESNAKLLVSDQDLMAMIDKIPKVNRVLECFLDHKRSEVQMDNVEQEEVEVVHESEQIQNFQDVADPKQNAHGVGAEADDASDFYDPDNDVEADDDDVVNGRNVINDINIMDWIVPYQSQTFDEDSDYALSDVLLSATESDDDRTVLRYPEFNALVDMANPQFEVGMVFGSFDEFKRAVREYAIKQRRNIHFKKNDTRRVKAVCKDDCPWNIWVSHMRNGTENVQVKTYNPSHSCSNEHNIKFLTVKWLVRKYIETFRADPNWSVPGIQVRIRDDLHLDISRQKLGKLGMMHWRS